MNKQPEIKHGSKLKAMFNRSSLRGYSQKITSGEITKKEIMDYIVKGGSLDQYRYYDRSRNFFIGAPQYSLLNFFIKARNDPKPLAENRLEILSILLSAGANPNFNIESAGITKSGNLAPILQACASDDLEAAKLLHKYGGDIDLKEKIYAGPGGPCIVEAQSIVVLEWLMTVGADINYKNEHDQTILDLAVLMNDSNEKVQWLINQGVLPKVGSPGVDALIEYVNYSLAKNKENLEYYRKKALEVRPIIEDPEYSIALEQEQIAKRQELLNILSSEKK